VCFTSVIYAVMQVTALVDIWLMH